MDSRMDQHQENNIEVLLEWLRSLRITEEDTSKETMEYTAKMSVALALATAQNKQAIMPKSIVLDLEWFDKDRTKFED